MDRNRLIELGAQAAERIHTTRLKSGLLSQFGTALIKIYEKDYHDEDFILSRAASILRKDIFDKDYKAFEGSFSTECQVTFPSTSLKLFINVLLEGPSIDSRKKN